jgi:hypothetical protein
MCTGGLQRCGKIKTGLWGMVVSGPVQQMTSSDLFLYWFSIACVGNSNRCCNVLGGSIKGFFLVLLPEGDGFIPDECMMYSSNMSDFEVRTFGNT